MIKRKEETEKKQTIRSNEPNVLFASFASLFSQDITVLKRKNKIGSEIVYITW